MSSRFMGPLLILLLLSSLLGGCQPVAREPDWAGVDDFLYQLQHADPDRIGATAFDLAVVTLATAGSSPHVIPALKDSPGGPKIVLCYMSIGLSETYHWYRQPEWNTDPPDWTAQREAILDQWVAAGKLVLTIDYTVRPGQIADAYFRAHARGYIPYVTDRSLGRLRINPGFEPDKDPSEWVFSTPTP
jgi:endo-alpha-1,4-polygalactosaminidase (GH114 family)